MLVNSIHDRNKILLLTLLIPNLSICSTISSVSFVHRLRPTFDSKDFIFRHENSIVRFSDGGRLFS